MSSREVVNDPKAFEFLLRYCEAKGEPCSNKHAQQASGLAQSTVSITLSKARARLGIEATSANRSKSDGNDGSPTTPKKKGRTGRAKKDGADDNADCEEDEAAKGSPTKGKRSSKGKKSSAGDIANAHADGTATEGALGTPNAKTGNKRKSTDANGENGGENEGGVGESPTKKKKSRTPAKGKKTDAGKDDGKGDGGEAESSNFVKKEDGEHPNELAAGQKEATVANGQAKKPAAKKRGAIIEQGNGPPKLLGAAKKPKAKANASDDEDSDDAVHQGAAAGNDLHMEPKVKVEDNGDAGVGAILASVQQDGKIVNGVMGGDKDVNEEEV